MAHITCLEEISLNTWPAVQQHLLDGWVVRSAGGYTGRANSVHPLYPGTLPVAEKLERVEAYYRQQGLPTKFKITSAAQPAELDELLTARGYTYYDRVSVQAADIAALQLPAAAGVVCLALDDWLLAYAACNRRQVEELAPARDILARIALPCAFMTVRAGETPVACGVGVVDRGYVGFFQIVTAPQARRQGYAARMMAAITAWGQQEGARQAFLQVVAANTPARTLYEKLGFREVYQYWYRVQADGNPAT